MHLISHTTTELLLGMSYPNLPGNILPVEGVVFFGKSHESFLLLLAPRSVVNLRRDKVLPAKTTIHSCLSGVELERQRVSECKSNVRKERGREKEGEMEGIYMVYQVGRYIQILFLKIRTPCIVCHLIIN